MTGGNTPETAGDYRVRTRPRRTNCRLPPSRLATGVASRVHVPKSERPAWWRVSGRDGDSWRSSARHRCRAAPVGLDSGRQAGGGRRTLAAPVPRSSARRRVCHRSTAEAHGGRAGRGAPPGGPSRVGAGRPEPFPPSGVTPGTGRQRVQNGGSLSGGPSRSYTHGNRRCGGQSSVSGSLASPSSVVPSPSVRAAPAADVPPVGPTVNTNSCSASVWKRPRMSRSGSA